MVDRDCPWHSEIQRGQEPRRVRARETESDLHDEGWFAHERRLSRVRRLARRYLDRDAWRWWPCVGPVGSRDRVVSHLYHGRWPPVCGPNCILRRRIRRSLDWILRRR